MQLSVGREALHQVFGEVNELASRYGLDVVSGVCTHIVVCLIRLIILYSFWKLSDKCI